MNSSAYTIRAMRRNEFDIAVGWARMEGWNPGLHDAEAFFPCDPGGFLGGFVGGKMIASISAVRYGPGYGFIGFYIVSPEFRGQGFGWRLWQAGMEHLREAACVGLDGVLAEVASYEKSGFVSAYPNRRYGGPPPSLPAGRHGIVDAREIALDRLVEFDRHFFPAPRTNFLSSWISLPGHRALAAVEQGRLTGFGVVRPSAEGAKIGPLYAVDAAIAERLLRALSAGQGGPVFLDVPEVNLDAVALAKAMGWTVSFETARMYRGAAPAIDLARLYGVTTFELG